MTTTEDCYDSPVFGKLYKRLDEIADQSDVMAHEDLYNALEEITQSIGDIENLLKEKGLLDEKGELVNVRKS